MRCSIITHYNCILCKKIINISLKLNDLLHTQGEDGTLQNVCFDEFQLTFLTSQTRTSSLLHKDDTSTKMGLT